MGIPFCGLEKRCCTMKLPTLLIGILICVVHNVSSESNMEVNMDFTGAWKSADGTVLTILAYSSPTSDHTWGGLGTIINGALDPRFAMMNIYFNENNRVGLERAGDEEFIYKFGFDPKEDPVISKIDSMKRVNREGVNLVVTFADSVEVFKRDQELQDYVVQMYMGWVRRWSNSSKFLKNKIVKQ